MKRKSLCDFELLLDVLAGILTLMHLQAGDGKKREMAWLWAKFNSLNTMRALFLMILVAMCSCSSKDRAMKALEEAKSLAAQGRYEEALDKHVWFHDHALETTPSYYGVRLSFALNEWVELGKKYPKALTKLKEIRDEKTARLLAGEINRATFHDVRSINHYLGESESTVRLFKEIEAARPEFAKSVYTLADKALIAAGEYALARKYLGDPIAYYEEAQRKFEKGMLYAKTGQNGEAARKAFESNFTDAVIRVITVLDKTDEPKQAREIQSKALAVLDRPEIRDAFKP